MVLNKKYGYARVSTKNQFNHETYLNQFEKLKNEGISEENIYFDNYSGKSAKDRENLNKLLELVVDGDTVVTTKLDRLARNASDALEIAEQLNKKGVKLHILNMGLIDNSPIGKLMFTVFSAFSEFERDLIVERMQEGKEYKRKHDPNFKDGRKSKLNTKQLEIIYKHFEDGMLTNEEIANMFNVSRRTIMYRKKEWKDMKNMCKL
ncbi:recombinase family protein [Enterococcus faecium]|uniref:recombinase family protein n=1 Tax=Enterococcus faecium TaxID=1352 RepID=UPI00298F0524|nr:recombinase family protein [Enterococcus faecium]MDW7852311.1 recombinase family protein [Enterococcus faecium]MDW7939827.1 recombinase family protein [Enterococcus faecium]